MNFHSRDGIFAINGDLDGEKDAEFIEREQYIGLIIGSEEFLMPIAVVHEINMLMPITYVPNAPQFVDGVINLRGKILPAINMRKLMGMARGNPGPATRIIIARYEDPSQSLDISVGLIVDGITYVTALLPTEIEHQSLPGKGTGAEFIGSISKHGQKIRGVIDLQRVIKAVAGNLQSEEQEAA